MTKLIEPYSREFNNLLDKFNSEHGLIRKSMIEEPFLPEGKDWIIELKDKTKICVNRCSYEVDNSDVYYLWVDYIEDKGVTIEINFRDKTVKEYVVIVPSDIASVRP